MTGVSANTVSEVSKILQPISTVSGRGGLSVSSTPSAANVFLDNNFIGITPLTINEVGAGSHLLTLKEEGYQDYSTTIQVNTGATSTVAAVLLATTPTPRSPLPVIMVLGSLLIVALLVRRKP